MIDCAGFGQRFGVCACFFVRPLLEFLFAKDELDEALRVVTTYISDCDEYLIRAVKMTRGGA